MAYNKNVKKKILCIEDDRKLVELYKNRLEEEGFDVSSCLNAEDGLIATLKFKPDLIFTGIMMPKVSGFDVIDILKNTPETKHIPIIVLSNLQSPSDIVRAMKLGASNYLIKSQTLIKDVVNAAHEQLAIQTDETEDTTINQHDDLKYDTSGSPLIGVQGDDWKYPPKKLVKEIISRANAGEPRKIAKTIEETFSEYGTELGITEANIGPQITQYKATVTFGELPESLDGALSKIANELQSEKINVDILTSDHKELSIEVPNPKRALVSLGSILEDKKYKQAESRMSFALGRDVQGQIVSYDFEESPFLVAAGQTGSGKSILYNVVLASLLLKNSPSELRLVIIDPKIVEFGVYQDIPHLVTPVINDPEQAKSALMWVNGEIGRRYREFANYRVKNIQAYNKLNPTEPMPNILILCDEIADLMMMDGKFYEKSFANIAQKGKAVGVHYILATSRPSSDVITDEILMNTSQRIALTTASAIDSIRMIGVSGAEYLLGKGDIFYQESPQSRIVRIQSPFISDEDVERVTDYIRILEPPKFVDIDYPKRYTNAQHAPEDIDNLYLDVLKYVVDEQKASTAMFQRKFRIGYGRAARLMEMLEENGVVGSADGANPRAVYRSEY